MATIERNRRIRPSTREVDSSYKIDTKKVKKGDTLIINIDHEDSPGNIIFKYELDGAVVDSANSIHFKAFSVGENWQIEWIKVNPKRIK